MAIQKKMQKKDLNYYLNLSWSYTIEPAKDEKNKVIYIIRVNEMPEVCTDAPTIAKAMTAIKEVLTMVLEAYLEQGDPIPLPSHTSKNKGDIAYRTTARRYSLLAKQAQQKRISMSQVIDNLIDTATAKTGKVR